MENNLRKNIEEENKISKEKSAIVTKRLKLFEEQRKESQKLKSDANIPDVKKSFDSKLKEISTEFQNAGMSIFSEEKNSGKFVTSNLVGDAIIEDLMSKVTDATSKTMNYNKTLSQGEKSLAKNNVLKRLFAKVRNLFGNQNSQETSKENVESSNKILSEISQINSEIENYNLKDNLSDSLAKHIEKWQYSEVSIPSLVENEVKPTLEKLGLENQTDKIQEKMQNSSQKDEKSDWELTNAQKAFIAQNGKKLADNFKNLQDTQNSQNIQEPNDENKDGKIL